MKVSIFFRRASVAEDMWYAGTADAVYQNIDIIEDYGAKYIVVLAATMFTRWTEIMLRQHVDTRRGRDGGVLKCPRKRLRLSG